MKRNVAGLLGLVLGAGASAAAAPIVVVPFEGRGTAPDLAWLAHAVAEALPRDLAFLGVPVIDGGERRAALDALELPNVPATLATAVRVAEALGAGRLVTGSYSATPGQVALSLRLMDVERGSLSAPLVARGPIEAVRALIRELAWDVALSGSFPAQRTREELMRRESAVPFAAFRHYCEALRPGDASARVRLLRRAVALASGYGDAQLALGALLLETGEFEPALGALSQAARDPRGARRARFLRGVALYELGRYTAAEQAWAELAAESPSAAVLNNLGLARVRVGSTPGGARAHQPSAVLRQAAELDGAADVQFNLAWALFYEGQDEAAAFWLRGRLLDDPGDVHARVVLSWALRRAARTAEADEEWRTVAALAPGYAGLAAPDLGRRFERLRRVESLPARASAGRSDTEQAARHAARGERLLEAGDAGAALAELTRAAYLDPHGARVHRLLARAHLRRGARDAALAELRMSLWCREDPGVRLELALLLRELGRGAEARAEAEAVLAAEPGNGAALTLLAELHR